MIGGRNAAVSNARYAREFYAPIIPIVVELRNQGLSLRFIARELDARGIIMRSEEVPIGAVHKGRWNAGQVRRILLRAEQQNSSKDTTQEQGTQHHGQDTPRQ